MDRRTALTQVGGSTTASIVAAQRYDHRYAVPYIPTSMETAKRMLEIAEVKPEDVVYDLGCGDARILVLAADLYKARKAVGYEIRPEVYKAAVKEVEARNLKERVTIVHRDLFYATISEATVITLYLSYGVNKELRPKLESEARLGARIVSHDFVIPGWKIKRKQKHNQDTIYLYEAPESFQER